jgi:hypothetical protein
MRIGEIDFPEDLIDAQNSGNLVIFAGAGVSRNRLSGLPDFGELAKEIAKATSIKRNSSEPIDRFLGRLADKGVKVTDLVCKILDKPTSKPNQLHRDILTLCTSGNNTKLVTTNIDQYFSTAAIQLKKEVRQYYAPALPPGNDFNGIVYLHGCTAQSDKHHIVLTDTDFGRAYLTQGWARHFVCDLFMNSNLVVLFIGYSLSDPPIYYISRALAQSKTNERLFILTPALNREEWKSRGLQPVIYNHAGGKDKHIALKNALNKWAEFSKMDILEHVNRIKDITSSGFTTDPEAEDYIQFTLRKTELTQHFVKYALDSRWLKWVDDKGIINSLFEPCAIIQTNSVAYQLSNWISKKFVLGNHHVDFEKLILHHRNRFNPLFWNNIVSYLNTEGINLRLLQNSFNFTENY